MKKTTILLFFLLGSTSLFAQSIKYTFNVGEKINIEQIANIRVDQDLAGMKMEMTTIISNSLIMEVESIEDEVAKIKSWYKDVSMDFNIGMGEGSTQELHVSSKEAPSEEGLMEAHNLVKSMIDEPFFIHLKSNGTIVKIDGMDVLEAKMRAAVTDEAILKDLGKDFSQEKLRADFARFFVPYPSKEIMRGDSWTSLISIPDLQLIDGEQTWTVDKIDNQNNTVDVIAKVPGIKLDKKENEVEMNLVGDMNTVYKINATTAWPSLITMKSDMTGTATMIQDGEDYTWPVEMKMNSTISMKKM